MARLASVVLFVLLSCSGASSRAQSTPRVRIEEPTVGPADSPRVYRRVLMRSRALLQQCLAPPRATRPYVVRFDVLVQPDGRMRMLGAQIPAHATRPDSHACLTEAIATLHAPTPHGGATLRLGIPMLFRKTS